MFIETDTAGPALRQDVYRNYKHGPPDEGAGVWTFRSATFNNATEDNRGHLSIARHANGNGRAA